ncbi:MAG: hypothetical protein ACXAEU_06370 [Candidatus Hodarchaeales archaeon]|jgi:hypothetical protein
MKSEVQADNNKKLGNLLADMMERAFRNDNHVQRDSKESNEPVNRSLKKESVQ